jgi:hypothetical protein
VALELQRPGMGSSLLFLMGADAQTGFLFFSKIQNPAVVSKIKYPSNNGKFVCNVLYI